MKDAGDYSGFLKSDPASLVICHCVTETAARWYDQAVALVLFRVSSANYHLHKVLLRIPRQVGRCRVHSRRTK